MANGARGLRRLLGEASAFGEAIAQESPLRWATQPYAITAPQKIARVDPKETSVLIFGGQASLGRNALRTIMKIPTARDVFERSSEIVRWDVAKYCTDNALNEEWSEHSDTAGLVVALAALELAQDERPTTVQSACAAVGTGAGEVAALVWAGALELETALRVLEVRGAALRADSLRRPGGTLAVWLRPEARLPQLLHAAREAVGEDAVCSVAAYLTPNHRLIAGDEQALQFIERSGGSWGVVRSARVSGPARHCALGAAAGSAAYDALRSATVRMPRARVLCAHRNPPQPYRNATCVRKWLPEQCIRPLRWEQTLHALFARTPGVSFPRTLALGAARPARAALRKVNAKAWDHSLQIPSA